MYERYYKKGEMKKTVLLCYPRSGSTFTTEIIKFLNYHSTVADLEGREEGLTEHPFNFSKDRAIETTRSGMFNEKFVKLHGHDEEARDTLNLWLNTEVTQPRTQTEEAALLLLLLRNPTEAFASHRWLHEHEADRGCKWTPFSSVDYFYKNLKTYDLYGGPKAVIYYEDLIEDPNKYVHDLCVLLDIPFEAGDMFMRDYDEHFDSCRQSYTHKHGEPRTDGRTPKTPIPKADQYWEVFFKKCEEFKVVEGRSLCERYMDIKKGEIV
jgi:hypothetical protein